MVTVVIVIVMGEILLVQPLHLGELELEADLPPALPKIRRSETR